MSGAGFSEATVVAAASEARRLGSYLLVGEIAEGGMGRVYLARRAGAARFEKLTAVKVLHPHLSERQPDLVDMFLDEARIASMIAHPNVCSVLDYGREKDIQFMVMEYLAGQPLREVIPALAAAPERRQDPMLYPILARIVAEACEGLHGAHTAVDEHGEALHVVHRDVSPGNVIVTYEGAVKIMDFGVAKATGRQHETSAGTFKGKFAYASPEAFEGVELDARSDVWSMGVVLWELLVGHGLFHRKSDAAMMNAIVMKDLPTPRSEQSGVPEGLDAICMRALSRDPDDRYATARDMARELNQFAVGSGVHIGTGEIAEWMAKLFPDQRKHALETDRAVRRLDPSVETAPVLSGHSLDQSLVSKVVVRGDEASETGMAYQATQVAPKDEPDPSARRRDDPTRQLRPVKPAVAGFDEDGPTTPSSPPPSAALPVITDSSVAPEPPRRTGLAIALVVLLLGACAAAAVLYWVTQNPSAPVRPQVTELSPSIRAPGPAVDDEPIDEPAVDEPAGEDLAGDDELAVSEGEDETAPEAPRAERERPRTARAERVGALNVVVVGGWADIHEGRRLLGRTPTRLELPVGRHRLRLSRPDGPSKTVTVRIQADEVTELSVELPNAPAPAPAPAPEATDSADAVSSMGTSSTPTMSSSSRMSGASMTSSASMTSTASMTSSGDEGAAAAPATD